MTEESLLGLKLERKWKERTKVGMLRPERLLCLREDSINLTIRLNTFLISADPCRV